MLSFFKKFVMISRNILIATLVKYGLGEEIRVLGKLTTKIVVMNPTVDQLVVLYLKV